MTIRYGLIGSGMMGQEHIRFLNLIDGCEVAAVTDPDEGMRNLSVETSGGKAKAFSDHRDMLSAGLCDALVIASPNDTHHGILLEVMDSGLPILCEKPLSTTAERCREVIAKAGKRTAPVWVAMEYRYMPPVERMLGEIAAGTVGTPRMISIREHRFPFLDKVGDWNRFNGRTGGTMVEKCCHFWDLMRLALSSDPVRVFASGAPDVNRQDGQASDMIDNAYVVVEFESGTRGMLDLCMFAEGSYWQEQVAVTGEKARVEARVPGPARFSPDGKERRGEIEISDRASKIVDCQPVDVDEKVLAAGDHHGSTYYQHERFRDLIIAGKGEPEVGLIDGLWSVVVGEAAEESASIGQAVDIKGVV